MHNRTEDRLNKAFASLFLLGIMLSILLSSMTQYKKLWGILVGVTVIVFTLMGIVMSQLGKLQKVRTRKMLDVSIHLLERAQGIADRIHNPVDLYAIRELCNTCEEMVTAPYPAHHIIENRLLIEAKIAAVKQWLERYDAHHTPLHRARH